MHHLKKKKKQNVSELSQCLRFIMCRKKTFENTVQLNGSEEVIEWLLKARTTYLWDMKHKPINNCVCNLHKISNTIKN